MAEVATVTPQAVTPQPVTPATIGPVVPVRKLEIRAHKVDRLINHIYDSAALPPSMNRIDMWRTGLGDFSKDELDAALREAIALGVIGQIDNWLYKRRR